MSGQSSVRTQALIGVALLLVIVAAGFGIIAAFTGHFTSYDVVYADVPASGTGISSGSVVIFRDITVGSVGSLGQELPDGLIRVQLHMTPGDIDTIPSGVRADVEIATVFGTQGINLVPQPGAAPGHLQAGATISSVGVSKTTTLQGDATDLDNLLKALHPAALDETLSAIATALKDQGPQLGTTIGQVATYLDQMLPEVPDIVNDVERLGPVANTLTRATPSILSTLSNGSVLATTITNDSTQLHQLLALGTPTANGITGILQGSEAAFEDLVANSAVLLGDVASNPNFVAQTLNGFDKWSKAFAAAESHGPYLSFAGDITIQGSVQAVAAALGVPGASELVEQGLGPENFNPPTYTAADCPTYQGESGPNCPHAATSAPAAGHSGHGVMTTSATQQASVKIATGLSGGKTPPSAAVATLLLQPVLLQLAKVP
ncbi:MAG TPA: MCE family protein [Acidimicrobiales bacterium]|jgi:phospholipid/cholesterol/gamma-HCH transport system substrate-binding protein